MRRTTAVASLSALSILLAACGSDTTAPATPTAETSTAPGPSASPSKPAPPSPIPQVTTAPAAPSPIPQVTTEAPSAPDPAPTQAPKPDPKPTQPPAPPEPAAPSQVSVSVVDYDFNPNSIEVAAGGTVTFTNNGQVTHTATVAGGGPDTGPLTKGTSGSLTFDTPGTYSFKCQFHPADMQGTIVVK